MMLTPDRRDAVEFFQTLAAGAPSEPARYLYLWSAADRTTTSFLVQDPGFVADATEWAEVPRDLYVGVAMGGEVLPAHRRITNATAAGLFGVHLDVDVAGEGHGKPNLPPTDEAALDLVDEFGVRPTLSVLSGHGFQFWWLFDEPWLFGDAADAALAAALLKGWVEAHRQVAAAHGWDHDAVGDLARLMRVPGTINAKVPERPIPVQLVSATGPRYTRTELTQLIEARPRRAAPERAASRPSSEPSAEAQPEVSFIVSADAAPPDDKLAALLRHPGASGSWNHNRPEFQDQSPSTYDLSLAALAVRAGWPDQEVVDLLIACRRLNGCPLKLRQDYLERTLQRARGREGDVTEEDTNVPLGGQIKGRGLIPVLADIVEDQHFFARDDAGVVYRYTDGRYVEATAWFGRQVRVLLEEGDATKSWQRQAPRNLADYVGAVAPRLWHYSPRNVLNVYNGLLDLDSLELRPHSAAHLSSVQLPVTFDPDAVCPRLDKFVSEVFPEDAAQVAWEQVAFVIAPDPSIQKAVLLLGQGGNGKSVWLRVVQGVLGPENYATVPLHKLEADRFSSSRLQGKLANICADLPAGDLKGTSVFKGLTGGDAIVAERKYYDSYDMRTPAKLIFSANTPPRSPDGSDAFFQRWLVVPFDRVFRGEVSEISSHVLDQRLQDPRELSGLLNRALAVLPALRERGLSEPLSCVEGRERFRAATDPVSVWIDQHTLSVPGAYVRKAQLVEQYNADAIKNGHAYLEPNAFGRVLRRSRPGLQDGQRRYADRRAEVWLDLILKPAGGLAAEYGESGSIGSGVDREGWS